MKLTTLFLPAAIILILSLATPCFALNGMGEYGLGAGLMMPDIEDIDTNNSIYYLFDYTAQDFSFELNYVDDGDMQAWLIHSDYLYPLTEIFQSEAYLGFGYSYLFANSDVLDDANGINICIGFNLQKNIDVRGRYFFLGSGDHILTAGATMYF